MLLIFIMISVQASGPFFQTRHSTPQSVHSYPYSSRDYMRDKDMYYSSRDHQRDRERFQRMREYDARYDYHHYHHHDREREWEREHERDRELERER